jgi:hypothetical protein
LFVRTTPGGLFSTAMNANSEKDKLDASFIEGPESPGDPILEEAPKKSGLFGNVTENPAKNLNSMFEKASDQTSQPEKTSIFAGANRENRNDAENPFVTSGQKSMEHGTTTLNDLINRNPSSMFVNKESPALTATPSIFQTGNATNPNPFMGNQSAKPQGIFGTMVPQAGQGSIFGQAGASSIFNNPGTSAPGGLFGNLGAGTSSSTGLFGNNK